jgi:hypothetical protein
VLSWDAVTAISGAVSAIVIVATVVVGYRQVGVAADQLAHLRSSTQLEGTMKVFADLDGPEFRAARLFVEHQLEQRMREPRFRDELQLGWQAVNEDDHPEIFVAQMFERIGTYTRHGLLDPVLIADYCGPLIREMWQKLDSCGYLEMHRRQNPYFLENFEYLYDAAMDWYDNDDPPFRTSRQRALPVVGDKTTDPTT